MSAIIPKGELLVEVLVEELPAAPMLRELPSVLEIWRSACANFNLVGAPEFFYTPRRLVIIDKAFPLRSPSREIEAFGPPLSIAFEGGDKNGKLTKAGESFLTRNNVSLGEVSTAQKDGKEVLYCKKTAAGVESVAVLGEIINAWLASLNFGKSMAWGDLEGVRFIRPVRNICALMDGESIAFSAFGVESRAVTFPHREFGFGEIEVKSVAQYLDALSKNGVILDAKKRESAILEQVKKLEKTHGVEVEIDKELLAEIVAITENPRALLGKFESEFLRIPSEVITTSMKVNQRYFAVFKNGALFNGFVVVANGGEDGVVIAGNEKVLRARLNDAAFFYENDLKNAWSADAVGTKMEKVVFVDSMNLAEKNAHENVAIDFLAPRFSVESGADSFQTADIVAIKNFKKADLFSGVVGEFPELQGIIGGYYAKAFGLGKNAAMAIAEQYLPTGKDSSLPESALGALSALSVKLSNIFALFNMNKIPSGSKDPFALRRAAMGALKIILARGVKFDLRSDLDALGALWGVGDLAVPSIREFLCERLFSILSENATSEGLPNFFRAALRQNHADFSMDVNEIATRFALIQKVADAAALATFKRVMNIIKNSAGGARVDETLLKDSAELALFSALKNLSAPVLSQNYAKELFGLNAPLAAFFEAVLVNDPDAQIATNRHALCYEIYNRFLFLGDLAELI